MHLEWHGICLYMHECTCFVVGLLCLWILVWLTQFCDYIGVLNPWPMFWPLPRDGLWLGHGPALDFCCCMLVCPACESSRDCTEGSGISKLEYPKPAGVCINCTHIYIVCIYMCVSIYWERNIYLCGDLWWLSSALTSFSSFAFTNAEEYF